MPILLKGIREVERRCLHSPFLKYCNVKQGRKQRKKELVINANHVYRWKIKDHPDVIWVSHEKAGVISVGEIREQVVNTVDIMPYKGPYKIYIIDEAEKMNVAAQNAILKTIEEPPEYAIIFY